MAETELAAPSPGAIIEENRTEEGTEKKRTRKRGRKEIATPKGFEDKDEFLQHIRTLYAKDKEADDANRKEAIADARFVAGEQWDDAVKQRRAAANKPTLTINRLPAYVAQLVGNRRLNDIGIKIIPDLGGTKKVAQIREGLIRSIQKNSRAQYAYDKAFEQQIIGGLGNFQVLLEYAHDDVFEQDIRIVAIPNALSVVWDQASVEPSGADANHVFVTDKVPRKTFKKKYPDAVAADWDTADATTRSYGWDTEDAVQVVSFWRMQTALRTIAMMADGSVQDVTEIDETVWFDNVMEGTDGEPMIREVHRRFAQMYLCTATDILAGPYDLPIPRVPVFRVPGWELFIEGDRIRWGLIRFARDPQKLHNFWRSTIAEKLVGSPKAKWLAADSAVEGKEQMWRESHLSDNPLLIWNAESGQKPERQPPVEMEAALIQEAGTTTQDIRDVTNLHAASLGMESNEVSGRAINARQRVGELGSVIYQDNLNLAIEEAGKVINALIPFVYDSARMIKVLGPDMVTEDQVKVNYEDDPESADITCGKYSVTVTTGPSYLTRRVEAREEMMSMVNAMPQTMAIAADKIVEAQDWPGADEIARRLRTQLPAGMIDEKDLTEEEQAQQAQQAEAAQQQQQIQQQTIELAFAEQQAKVQLAQAQANEAVARAREAEARAAEAEARARKTLADIGINQQKVDVSREKLEIDRERVALDAVETLTPAENGARN